MKRTKYNWLLSFPGYWHTKEGYKLGKIEKPARIGYAWFRFKGREFEADGAFEAQLKAEEIIKKDLETFERALNNMKYD